MVLKVGGVATPQVVSPGVGVGNLTSPICNPSETLEQAAILQLPDKTKKVTIN